MNRSGIHRLTRIHRFLLPPGYLGRSLAAPLILVPILFIWPTRSTDRQMQRSLFDAAVQAVLTCFMLAGGVPGDVRVRGYSTLGGASGAGARGSREVCRGARVVATRPWTVRTEAGRLRERQPLLD